MNAIDRKDDGFTLIETLVAFLILALSLAVINQAVSQATINLRKSEAALAVSEVSQRVMAAAREGRELHTEGVDPATGFHWRWEREQFERQDGSNSLTPIVLVTVTVTRGRDGPQTVLRSLLYGERS